MNKDILDQYIYWFPFKLPDSCHTIINSISFQTYFKESGILYNKIEDALKEFFVLFNRISAIGPIVMFYEKDNDFICTIVDKLFPYIEERY